MSSETINHGIQSGGGSTIPDTGEGNDKDDSSSSLDGILGVISNIYNSLKDLASNITNPIVSALSTIKNTVANIGTTILDGISNFFKDTVENIKNLAEFVGNFWDKISNFFLHIFVPTDEQWEMISENHQNMGESLKSHLPFISLFNSEYKKAQETVAQTDFLVITIPEFSFEGGGIVAKSDKQKVINVRDKYEPYRAYVRNLLFFIVIACAFVLIIKNILNYHGVFDDSNSDKGGSKN